MLSGNCLFHVQVAELQPWDPVKNYFTSAFQPFYTRTKNSRLQVLKSLKSICEEVKLYWICEMPFCKFTKKTLSRILFHVFCLHFLKMHHDYFFRSGFESVQAQFPSAESSITCKKVVLPVQFHDSFKSPIFMLNMTYDVLSSTAFVK